MFLEGENLSFILYQRSKKKKKFDNQLSTPQSNSNIKIAYAHRLTPRRRGLISHTYLWAGGFQRYRKSFKIGHKPFYSQVNDKEW